MNLLKWLLPCLALALTACNQNPKLANLATADQEKVAREYVRRLMAGDVVGLTGEFDPATRRPDTPRAFVQMRALLPAETPTSVGIVGHGSSTQPAGTSHVLNYQYGFRDKWFLIVVGWRDKPGAPRVLTGLSVTVLERSIQEMTAFTFKNARPRHYAFMAALILVPAFMLVSLVTCIRMRSLPAKGIWVILILVGVVQFSLNWTSGALLIMLWSIMPFGVSAAAASDYAPWIISFSVPLGAMAFWVRRWWLLRAQRRSLANVAPV